MNASPPAGRSLSRLAGDGRAAASVRLVHLGLGNFFRAHQAWYTDLTPDAGDWGIAASTGRSGALAESLTAQDGLYTLITQAPDGNRFDVLGSLSRAHAAADHPAWLGYLSSPDVRAVTVTVTVTEAGYLRGPTAAWTGTATTSAPTSRPCAPTRPPWCARPPRGWPAAAPPAAAPTPAHSLIQAHSFVRQAVGSAVGPLRDATMGYLAVLSGRASEAEALLRAAWAQCDPAADPDVAAVVAQRLALHGVGRLRGDEVVEWARRALELAAPDDPVRVEAEALLGLGLSWQGRLQEGVAAYEAVLARLPDDCGVQAERVWMAQGWLFLVADDLVTARALLARAAPAALRAGSVRIAVWSYVWLARAEFVLRAWDEAAV